MILHPMILSVSPSVKLLKGKERVQALRKSARRALKLVSDIMDISPLELKKDIRGAPLPFNNYYWSISHKVLYSAAVIAREPIGIDIEEIKPRSIGLWKRVADEEEWNYVEQNLFNFFRYWTAKEAVLKAIGIGIADLSICRIIGVPNEKYIYLEYKGQKWLVEQIEYDNHLIAIVKNDNEIKWHFI